MGRWGVGWCLKRRTGSVSIKVSLFWMPSKGEEWEVGVERRQYYVSSYVERSILVMGHQEEGVRGRTSREREGEKERESLQPSVSKINISNENLLLLLLPPSHEPPAQRFCCLSCSNHPPSFFTCLCSARLFETELADTQAPTLLTLTLNDTYCVHV